MQRGTSTMNTTRIPRSGVLAAVLAGALVLAGCTGGGGDVEGSDDGIERVYVCLLYTSPSPRDS